MRKMEDPTVFVRTMPNVYYRHTTGDTTPDMETRRRSGSRRTEIHAMEEKKGHFEKGAWVEEKDEGPANAGTRAMTDHDPMEKRVREVSSLVSTSFSELIALARDLVATPEGHAHIRSHIEKVSSEIEKSLSHLLENEGEKTGTGLSQKGEGPRRE